VLFLYLDVGLVSRDELVVIVPIDLLLSALALHESRCRLSE
jgi:hypothetical protein